MTLCVASSMTYAQTPINKEQVVQAVKESQKEEKAQMLHTGKASFFNGGYTGGCAMLDPVSTDYDIAALNIYDYNDALMAGAYLEVTGEKGRVKATWRVIAFPTNEPISYKFKEGSSKYWCGVQVRNHRYPVAKLEYKNAKGEFVTLHRERYNYFISSEMGEGPFTFRVTDIYGHVIIDENVPLTLDHEVKGKANFEYLPNEK